MSAYTAYRLMRHAEVRSVRLYDAPPRVPGPRAGPWRSRRACRRHDRWEAWDFV